jgi:hypothetical protein
VRRRKRSKDTERESLQTNLPNYQSSTDSLSISLVNGPLPSSLAHWTQHIQTPSSHSRVTWRHRGGSDMMPVRLPRTRVACDPGLGLVAALLGEAAGGTGGEEEGRHG